MSNAYFYPQPPTMLCEESYQALDPLIREVVRVLRAGGVETYESCQGGDGHAYTEPTVRFHGEYGAGFRAFGIAKDNGMPVAELRRGYSVLDGELVGPHWEMTFVAKKLPAWNESRLPAEGRA